MPALSPRGGRRRAINEVNMVPFIDVMLVLLIIFMVTAPLITPSLLELPSVGQASKQPDRIIQIVIGKDERLELKLKDKTNPVKLEALAAAVKRAQTEPDSEGKSGGTPKTPITTAVVISADKTVQYERVVKVMDTLQRAGIQRVGLSVQLVP
jgi:biopolymer transport protein TolR